MKAGGVRRWLAGAHGSALPALGSWACHRPSRSGSPPAQLLRPTSNVTCYAFTAAPCVARDRRGPCPSSRRTLTAIKELLPYGGGSWPPRASTGARGNYSKCTVAQRSGSSGSLYSKLVPGKRAVTPHLRQQTLAAAFVPGWSRDSGGGVFPDKIVETGAWLVCRSQGIFRKQIAVNPCIMSLSFPSPALSPNFGRVLLATLLCCAIQ